MQTTPTTEELQRLVHRFYPANLHVDAPSYKSSPEYRQLEAARQAATANRGQWAELLARLRATVPEGTRVEDWTALRYDACRRCRLYPPGTARGARDVKAVVGLASILAPVYAVYASHQLVEGRRVVHTHLDFPPLPAELESMEALLASALEGTFGFVRLPNEVLFAPVTDLQIGDKHPHEVQLIDAMFTEDRW